MIVEDKTRPPWPPRAKLPHWARDRHGRPAVPALHHRMVLDDVDRYFVALYRRRGRSSYVLAITGPDDTGYSVPLWREHIRVRWPRDPVMAYEDMVADYLQRMYRLMDADDEADAGLYWGGTLFGRHDGPRQQRTRRRRRQAARRRRA